jgi:transcriptional regulator with XRE-family HTH domain
MARTALDWTRQDLASASDISERTIARFEAGEAILPKRVQALRGALEAVGVSFIDNGQLAGGVIPPSDHAERRL